MVGLRVANDTVSTKAEVVFVAFRTVLTGSTLKRLSIADGTSRLKTIGRVLSRDVALDTLVVVAGQPVLAIGTTGAARAEAAHRVALGCGRRTVSVCLAGATCAVSEATRCL